jgi:hypothetical protein
MTDNSQSILNDVLAQRRQELAPETSEQDFFELFCAEQILKDYDLSYEEVQAGIVDGEHDGGADAVYSFVNGELVLEDFDTSPFKKDVKVELHIIQSRTSGGFSESPVNRLISLTRHLLKLDNNFDQLTQYNEAVKGAFDNFRRAYRELASRFPDLKIHFYYASKKAEAHVHANLQKKADELKEVAQELFPYADVQVDFLGAKSLLDLARRRPKTSYDLKVAKSLSADHGYLVLTTLSDYNSFLRDEGGEVRKGLFESNVRDFQGTTEVNAEIENTLKNEQSADFWWLNNGVTVLASKATLNGEYVSISNPQIVNGLQTSTQIARFFGGLKSGDNRKIMVKIVSSEDEETRDKIIKATNSQNAVQPATLRATDKVQRDIEETLKSSGLYYDRRKNYYKNEGKPAEKIISIPLMAQAVMSAILARPDTARARPSSLIKDNQVYRQVFSEEYPVALYSVAGALIRSVDRVLKSRAELTTRDRANLRFYVLFWLAASATGKVSPVAADVAKIDLKKLDDGQIEAAIDQVFSFYTALGATDQIAKGPELKRQLAEELQNKFGPTKQQVSAPSEA